uniref:RNA-dependent RNA polymerase n=1 Tax=Gigaspora rosea mitovirus 5 TaxID=2933361 RepID=A0A9Y0T4P1_9VIRU|nr:TPA_asm: RNA-dependent RNA polymerase [Gigaspora rosea mitovirus 5]
MWQSSFIPKGWSEREPLNRPHPYLGVPNPANRFCNLHTPSRYGLPRQHAWHAPLGEQLGESHIVKLGGGTRSVRPTQPRCNHRASSINQQLSTYYMINHITFFSGWPNGMPFTSFYALLHTTPALRRSYKEWTEALRSTRFTPVEVLAVATGVQYVAVDPTNEDLLLPLSSKRYTAMQQDLMREQSSLTVLLGPGDIRKPGSLPVTADGFLKVDDPNQTSPAPPQDGVMPNQVRHGFAYLRKLVMASVRKGDLPVHRRTKVFATHLMKNTKVVAGRVVMTRVNLGPLVVSWGLYLHQLLGHPLRRSFRQDLHDISVYLTGLLVRGGPLFVARYLKVSLFMIQKHLAGEPLRFTGESGIFIGCTKAGLPRWLPVRWRLAIRSRNYPMIRLVTSLLTFYKAVHTPCSVVSLAAVTQPHPEIIEHYEDFGSFVSWLLRKKSTVYPCEYILRPPVLGTKAGPNISPGGLGIFLDAKAWVDRGDDNELFRFMRTWKIDPLIPLVHDCAARVNEFRLTMEDMFRGPKSPVLKLVAGYSVLRNSRKCPKPTIATEKLILGKLCFLEEAAGKVRTIAIGDFFTQWMMRPIHDTLFRILKAWEEVDGTFNQQRAVDNFSSRGYTEIFSYDLSKATDTIPHRLYLPIVGTLWGEAEAKAWLALLVERDFTVATRKGLQVKPDVGQVRYTRGQPMGFLSSWASLAVLHHLIVQYCAHRVRMRMRGTPEGWRTGILPFTDYLVLGDDIVIACPLVAQEYTQFCSSSGIELSLYKSFVSSKGFMNFASQSVIQDQNVSPASALEHFGITSLLGRVSFLQTLNSKGFFGTPGSSVKVGTLVRGLFSPTFFKLGIKPALVAGKMPHLLKIGISALANTRLFPNLGLNSAYRLPWIPAITSDEAHVRSILIQRMEHLTQAEHLALAEALYKLIVERFSGNECQEGIITSLQGKNALYRTFPFLRVLEPEDFWKDLKEGPFGKLQALRRSFHLTKLSYEPGVGSTYVRVPQRTVEELVEALMHDIEVIVSIENLPGFSMRVPPNLKKFMENQAWLPFVSVLLGCLATNQQDPLAVHTLLAKLTRSYRAVLKEDTDLGRATMWLTAESVTPQGDDQAVGPPASDANAQVGPCGDLA